MNEHFTKQYWQDLIRDFLHALRTKKFWRELVIMTLGIAVGAAAVYYFLMPSHLIIGTISGLSIVINTLIGGDADTFSYLVMGINAFLLLLAFLPGIRCVKHAWDDTLGFSVPASGTLVSWKIRLDN